MWMPAAASATSACESSAATGQSASASSNSGSAADSSEPVGVSTAVSESCIATVAEPVPTTAVVHAGG